MNDLAAYCIPGHRAGSKPQVVPVAGNNDRLVPVFVVYHGREYLAADGTVTRHPVHMTWAAAADAITAHEARAKAEARASEAARYVRYGRTADRLRAMSGGTVRTYRGRYAHEWFSLAVVARRLAAKES